VAVWLDLLARNACAILAEDALESAFARVSRAAEADHPGC
jgi:NifU-like protein involved in Fe-S cluster formation